MRTETTQRTIKILIDEKHVKSLPLFLEEHIDNFDKPACGKDES